MEWKRNKLYPNIFLIKVNNEQEYIKSIKDLYGEFDIFESYLGSEWYHKEHMFNNDLQSWHEFFETPCMIDEKYDEIDLPEPIEYDGEIGNKPELEDYPAIIIFNQELNLIVWQNINNL